MKAIFRKIFIIFFLSIYAVTASGFHLVLHYCGDRLAFFDINGYHHAEGCCADEDIFSLLNSQSEDDCCTSESTYVKIKSEQFSSKNLEAKLIAAQSLELFFLPKLGYVPQPCSIGLAIPANDLGPPEPHLPNYLLFNNLRI